MRASQRRDRLVTNISVPLIVILVVIGLAELGVFLWALIDVIRRPQVKYLPRWAWIVIIFVFELIGSIVYLAMGRGETAVIEAPPARPAQTGASAQGSDANEDTGDTGASRAATSPDAERLAAELHEQRSGRAIDTLYGPKTPE
jgi:hypothetical protein